MRMHAVCQCCGKKLEEESRKFAKVKKSKGNHKDIHEDSKSYERVEIEKFSLLMFQFC